MDEDLPTRKRSKNLAPFILAGLGILSGFLIIFGIAFTCYNQGKNEEKLAKLAKEQYEKGEYNEALKNFEKLTTEYPSSAKIEEYKFFRDLAQMQTVVRAVTNRENYDAAV